MNRYKQVMRCCSGLILGLSTLFLSNCSSGSSTASNGTGTTTAPSTPASASLIYALQTSSQPNFVEVFSATATGPASPTATLSLPTGAYPNSLVTDSSGQIYVGCQCLPIDEVLVYPAGSTGAAVPSRSIVVPQAPFEIAVDPSGLLYVSQFVNSSTPTVAVYSATANGLASPLRTIFPSGIQAVTALAADSSGNLYVAGETPKDQGLISVYPPTATGSAAPSRTIQSYFNFWSLTVDSSGNLFATTDGPNEEQLVEYSPTATGMATPGNSFTLATPLPQVSGIGSITQDAAGNFYFIASSNIYRASNAGITVYTLAPGFTSTSTPVRTFTLSSYIPLTIAVH